MKAVIIVPAFNESAIIYKVLRSLPKNVKGVTSLEVLVINDGSTDSTVKEAQKVDIKVLTHLTNRGLGAAIKTGLTWAKLNNMDIAITFDSDGQHDARDLYKLINPLLVERADLVIGSRFKSKQGVPTDRKILNWLANVATFLIFGVRSTDSQSGLRAFSKKAINVIDFKGERMDFSSEILHEAKMNNLIIKEVPIKAIYTDYSRKKGQKNINAVPIMLRFLVRFVR